MRLLISSLFYESPFKNLQRHTDKVKERAQFFKEAVGCHIREALHWLFFRPVGLPDEVVSDLDYLVGAVIPPIVGLAELVTLAEAFFRSKFEAQRATMKGLI
ncbi:MAG: hypothetical protein QGG48_08590 [Desulfatiglandales bacterium]|jgi:hypothetical protein|nr:hypothetical protein [Desulfatiglandales bacterium]